MSKIKNNQEVLETVKKSQSSYGKLLKHMEAGETFLTTVVYDTSIEKIDIDSPRGSLDYLLSRVLSNSYEESLTKVTGSNVKCVDPTEFAFRAKKHLEAVTVELHATINALGNLVKPTEW